jgi:hypothetical protein
MVFSIFCESFIIFGQTIAQVVEVIYVPFKNVCMSLFFWGDDV